MKAGFSDKVRIFISQSDNKLFFLQLNHLSVLSVGRILHPLVAQGKCSVTTVAVSTVNGIRSSSDSGRYAESVITPYGYPFTYGVRLVNNGLLERYPFENRLYTCGNRSP